MFKIIKLLSGSIFGQAITLATFPLITRLYSPAEFGAFQVYISFCNAVGLAAALSLDRPIYTMSPSKHRSELSSLGMIIVLFVSILACPLYILFAQFVEATPLIISGISVVPLVFLYILVRGIYLIVYANAISDDQIKSASMSLLARDIGRQSSRVAFGYTFFNSFGLIFSGVIDWLFGAACLLIGGVKLNLVKIGLSRAASILRQYKSYIFVFSPSSVLTLFTSQLPIFLIASIYGASSAGLYSAGFIMIDRPSRIVAKAVSDILSKQIVQGDGGTSRYDSLKKSTRQMKISAVFALIFIMIAAISFYFLCDFLLGEAWKSSAEITIFASAYVFSLFIDEMSVGIFAVSEQHLYMALKQIVLILCISSIYVLSHMFSLSLNVAVLASGVVSCVIQLYFLVFLIKHQTSKY